MPDLLSHYRKAASGCGDETLVQLFSRTIGNPVMIADVNFNRLTTSDDDDVSDELRHDTRKAGKVYALPASCHHAKCDLRTRTNHRRPR